MLEPELFLHFSEDDHEMRRRINVKAFVEQFRVEVLLWYEIDEDYLEYDDDDDVVLPKPDEREEVRTFASASKLSDFLVALIGGIHRLGLSMESRDPGSRLVITQDDDYVAGELSAFREIAQLAGSAVPGAEFLSPSDFEKTIKEWLMFFPAGLSCWGKTQWEMRKMGRG